MIFIQIALGFAICVFIVMLGIQCFIIYEIVRMTPEQRKALGEAKRKYIRRMREW